MIPEDRPSNKIEREAAQKILMVREGLMRFILWLQ